VPKACCRGPRRDHLPAGRTPRQASQAARISSRPNRKSALQCLFQLELRFFFSRLCGCTGSGGAGPRGPKRDFAQRVVGVQAGGGQGLPPALSHARLSGHSSTAANQASKAVLTPGSRGLGCRDGDPLDWPSAGGLPRKPAIFELQAGASISRRPKLGGHRLPSGRAAALVEGGLRG